MLYAATARWDFRGETWFNVQVEAANLNAAGAQFYALLPPTFFRGTKRLVAIGPANIGPLESRASSNSGGSPGSARSRPSEMHL